MTRRNNPSPTPQVTSGPRRARSTRIAGKSRIASTTRKSSPPRLSSPPPPRLENRAPRTTRMARATWNLASLGGGGGATTAVNGWPRAPTLPSRPTRWISRPVGKEFSCRRETFPVPSRICSRRHENSLPSRRERPLPARRPLFLARGPLGVLICE